MDTTHVPSWLQRSHLEFTEKLFCKGAGGVAEHLAQAQLTSACSAAGIHANPILVAQTLYKMKGQPGSLGLHGVASSLSGLSTVPEADSARRFRREIQRRKVHPVDT